jgi:hypothetical protein
MISKGRIIVAGCSVSDYSGSDITYGEVLASLANVEYIDESAECGSNFRIWRRITTLIRNSEITPNDLLIIQYTTPERKEFYSYVEFDPNKDAPVGKTKPLKEPYVDGSTIKFKFHSHEFYHNEDERRFLLTLQEGFTSVHYDNEVFQNFQYMFQFMLNELGIKTIFLRELHYQPFTINTIDSKTQLYFSIDDYFREGLATPMGNLYGHLNDAGHTKLGNDLFNFAKEHNFISW